MPSHGIPGDHEPPWQVGFWSLGDMGNTHIRDWKLSWAQVYNSGSWMKLTNLKDGVWQLDFPSHFVYQNHTIGWFHDKISSIKKSAGTVKLEIQSAILMQAAHCDLDSPYPAKSGAGKQCCSGRDCKFYSQRRHHVSIVTSSQPIGDDRSWGFW